MTDLADLDERAEGMDDPRVLEAEELQELRRAAARVDLLEELAEVHDHARRLA